MSGCVKQNSCSMNFFNLVLNFHGMQNFHSIDIKMRDTFSVILHSHCTLVEIGHAVVKESTPCYKVFVVYQYTVAS